MTDSLDQLRRASILVAWILFLLFLPVTSSPLFARVAGASTVAPLAALPLIWILVAWALPHVLKGGSFPAGTVPLVGFALVALVASAVSFFLEIPPFKEKTILSQEIPALMTLGLGLAFYLVVAGWPRTNDRLKLTLRLLNFSGLIIIGWSAAQAAVVLFLDGDFPPLMAQFQDWLSLRGIFAVQVSGFPRLTGFAYEPSWLAHQLNVLYLPIWLAATVESYSAHRRRLGKVSLENILLIIGVLVLILSFSRIGMLAFALVFSFLIVKKYMGWVRRSFSRLEARFRLPKTTRRLYQALFSTLSLGLFFSVYLAFGITLVYGLSRFDSRLARLFDPAILAETYSIFAFTNQLAFAERVVYWAAGWEIFNTYPLFGVGLGNAGFFFPEKMPAFGWGLTETLRIFYYQGYLPNTKSMWVRILTETGLTGFAFFAGWLFTLWSSAKIAARSTHRRIKTVALAGQLAIVAFLVEGFSIDSFALPYLWIATGLLTAGVHVYRASIADSPPSAVAVDSLTERNKE